MSGRVFVDSNVLIYAYDSRDGQRQIVAQELLVGLAQSRRGVLFAQVLGEFFVVVTRKIAHPMTSSEAGVVVAELGELEVVPLDLTLVRRAIETQ